MVSTYRAADPFGLQRVLKPKGVLPQQAAALDSSLTLAQDEMLIDVESLNIDSASFRQIREHCQDDPVRIAAHIEQLVNEQGKMHNPVTGSGGMLIGTVAELGPSFPFDQKPVRIGDRIATMVSLSLTPLKIKKIKKIHLSTERVDIEGHAVLFASGVFARLPDDLPERVSLAVLDVAGAPAQTQRLTQEGQTVIVIGGGGKSGVLCLYEAKKKSGVRTIAIDFSREALDRLSNLSFVDEVIQADARNAMEVMDRVWNTTRGYMGNLVINVTNLPGTEMASILACRSRGIVYFFSMATQFTRAALGAEGVGCDIDLRIGNGYADGHAELALNLLRESDELRQLFLKHYS